MFPVSCRAWPCGDSPPCIREQPQTMKKDLISYRFAVVVMSILLGASAAGWIMTELIPPDVPERSSLYRDQWGETAVWLVNSLRLFDPFHSFWYRTVLALFLLVLTLCLVTRSKRFLRRSFRVRIPERAEELLKRPVRTEMTWSGMVDGEKGRCSPGNETLGAAQIVDLLDETARYLRTRGFSVRTKRGAGDASFVAVAGGWRFVGSFLFHIGILVIALGWVIGSFWGGTEFEYGTAGDLLPLPGSRDSMLVERFRILMTENKDVIDYISTISIIGESGDTVMTGDIEVNHPLRYMGLNIYQSSYYVVENDFDSAEIVFAGTDAVETDRVLLRHGDAVPIRAGLLLVRPLRFLPDFRLGRNGPYSASMTLGNPALEIEVSDAERSERGWLFLHYPRFNSKFDFAIRARLVSIEPLFFTGLQIAYNPGEYVFMTGIVLATIGLGLLYLFNYRVIGGVVDGRRLVVAGIEFRWRVSFEKEFDTMSIALKERLGALLRE
jgi:cytochrome c biogenesis protein